MSLIRLILIALVAWLIARGMRRRSQAGPRLPRVPVRQRMVRCGHCGVHVPMGDALGEEGRYYCCAEHRIADRQS